MSYCKKCRTERIVALCAAVTLIAVAAVFFVSKLEGTVTSQENLLPYIKDNKIYLYDGNKKIELTGDMPGDNEYSYGASDLYDIKFSPDERYVYYIDKMYDQQSGTLCRKDLKQGSETNNKVEIICSDVNFYEPFDDKVLYIETIGEEIALYLWTSEEVIKLVADFDRITWNEDYNQFIWTDQENVLFYSDLKAGIINEKVDEIKSLSMWTEDLSRIYYVDNENTLYCLNNFVKEKVASDARAEGTFNSGRGIYYKVIEGDFDYQEGGIGTLYAYDGLESRMLVENAICTEYILPYHEDNQFESSDGLYLIASLNDLELSLSNSSESSDHYNRLCQDVYEAPVGTYEVKLLFEGAALDIDASLNNLYLYDDKNELLYCGVVEGVDRDRVMYALEQRTVTASGIGGTEAVDRDLFRENVYYSSYLRSISQIFEDKLYYISYDDQESFQGILRCEGQDLAYDVSEIAVISGRFFILSERNDTLYEYKNGKMEELLKEVRYYKVLSDGSIAALCEVQWETEKGDLYLYKDGKTELLEEGVSEIHDIYGD